MLVPIPAPFPTAIYCPVTLPDSDSTSKAASQALKVERPKKTASLSERQIAPVLSKKRLALELALGVVPGLVHLAVHSYYEAKIKKSAAKLVKKINDALSTKNTEALITALAQIKKKINDIPSRLFYRYLGADETNVKMSLLCLMFEEGAALPQNKSLDDLLAELKAQFEKAPQNDSEEYQEAKKLVDGLIFFRKGLNGDLPLIYIPQVEMDELQNGNRPSSPTHLDFDDELELVDLPPSPSTPAEEDASIEFKPVRTSTVDSIATTVESPPSRSGSLSSESDSACIPHRTESDISIESESEDPALALPPAPLPKLSPEDQFLNQVKKIECIHTKELFWILFLGMKVENAVFNEATREFEIVLDQPYTVHVPALKKGVGGMYPPPGPNAPKLKFSKVLKGKITKKDNSETIEFQDCVQGSAKVPLLGQQEVAIKEMRIASKKGETNFQFKLPIVGDQSIPLQVFWDVMTGSCILPADQPCNRDPALTIGHIRAEALIREAHG